MSEVEREMTLGLPEVLTRDEAGALMASLSALWESSTGAPVGDLRSDLALLRRWFDPVAQGQRLRRELAEVATVAAAWIDPGEPLAERVGQGCFLITPEGRCAMEILRRLPDRDAHVLSQQDFAPLNVVLVALYRDWSRHRIRSVVALLEGNDKPLQISASGVVVALLVNRNTSSDRALERYRVGLRRDIVDEAFFSAVSAFSQAIAGPESRPRKDPRLISGWMLHEAARRLGPALAVSDAADNSDGKVWISEAAVPQVVQTVARDLQRGNRARATRVTFGVAYDALVDALRRQFPALAGFGLVHERPIETEHLREMFMRLLADV